MSAALIGAELAAASAERSGQVLASRGRHWAAGLGGGLLVVLSYTLDAPRLMDGGLPGPYAWPLFVAGMVLALAAAADVLRGPRRKPTAATS